MFILPHLQLQAVNFNMPKRSQSPAKHPMDPPTKRQTRSSSPAKPPNPKPQPAKAGKPGLTVVPGFPAFAEDPIPYPPPLDFLTPNIWKIPTTNNAITNFDAQMVARDALETNVILHPKIPDLLTSFLRLKLTYGSDIEKSLYQGMSQHELVVRLIEKRVLHFVNVHDYTVLRDLTKSAGNFDAVIEWLRVGQGDESKNRFIKMAEYLTYDEIMLASLIGTSGPTFFINAGERDNCGRKDPVGTFEDRGIIVGLVGPRFQRPGQMDAAYIQQRIDPTVVKSNPRYRQQDPRVTQLLLDFFGGGELPGTTPMFNSNAYRARTRLTVETLLLEADDRAAQHGKKAYVHLVGLGLGVWAVDSKQQGCMYVEVVNDILKNMNLKWIGTLEIAWVSATADLRKACIACGEAVGIRVMFNKLPPCKKLDTGELLIRCWAWDGNSLPGNEYYSGLVDDSDDPAAVANSTAAELHNPYVNPFSHRIKVLQDRTRV